MRQVRRFVHGLAFILALVAITAFFPGSVRAAAETWLCPICQVQRVERATNAADLTCPRCGQTLGRDDLRWTTAYISIRTRPAEVTWDLLPECGIFRNDGLLAADAGKPIWVPWSAVDYYIPRMRILRLTSGKELQTPYAKGPDCAAPPKFVTVIADSIGDFMSPRSIRTSTKEEELSTIFLAARDASARDSARVRFISEVEAGKHPRLPRTQPQALRVATPSVPPSAMEDSTEVVLEARIAENGQVLKVDRVKGSGNPEIDRAALMAAYRSSMVVGGEMGVGVPCSLILSFQFTRGTVTAAAKPARPPMWREWVEPPPK